MVTGQLSHGWLVTFVRCDMLRESEPVGVGVTACHGQKRPRFFQSRPALTPTLDVVSLPELRVSVDLRCEKEIAHLTAY